MFNRARRVLEPAPNQRGRQTNQRTSTNRLTPEQRLWKWYQFCLRAMVVLEYLWHKTKAEQVLGLKVFKQLTAEENEAAQAAQSSTSASSSDSRPFTRVLRAGGSRWVVGKPREASDGKPQVDLRICEHLAADMRHRGNGKDIWWTCTLCLSRWDRIPVTHFEKAGTPQDSDRALFGKHTGRTYLEIFRMDKQYCEWVLRTAESGDDASADLIRLAKWIASREFQLIQQDATMEDYHNIPAIGENDDDDLSS